MQFQMTLANRRHPEYGVLTVPFPIPDEQYDEIIEMLESLEIGDPLNRDCYVDEISDDRPILKRLEKVAINIDEADYLAKRLDSFCVGEDAQFQGMAAKTDISDMTDFINLTFCCQRATVITDFSDLNAIGRNHVMNLNGGSMPSEQYKNLDGRAEALKLILNENGSITPYGVIYNNGMKLEQLYDGRHFPAYLYKPSIMDVSIMPCDDPNDVRKMTILSLPLSQMQIDRAMLRAGFDSPNDICLAFENSELPNEVDIVLDFDKETLDDLNVCIKEKPNVFMRELKFLPIQSRELFEQYKHFVEHKDVTFKNIKEELEVIDDPSCFTEEQAAELRPIFQERAELYDVNRAVAFMLRNHGCYNGNMSSFAVKELNLALLLKRIEPVSKRLQNVVIENKDALKIIPERDSEDTVMFVDPPYQNSEKAYEIVSDGWEFHQTLHDVLAKCCGYEVITYNESDKILELYEEFYICGLKRTNSQAQTKNSIFNEVVITNYDPRPYMEQQMNLFEEDRLEKYELVLIHIPECDLRRKNIEERRNEKQRKQDQHPDVIDDVQQSGQPVSGTVHPAQCHAASAETDDSVGTDPGVGVGSGGGQSSPDESE